MVIEFVRLDVNNELMSLHIGDRILEVNGTPVKDTSLENIENLIRYSDTVLQVSITQLLPNAYAEIAISVLFCFVQRLLCILYYVLFSAYNRARPWSDISAETVIPAAPVCELADHDIQRQQYPSDSHVLKPAGIESQSGQ